MVNSTILITGCAGFIGGALTERLLMNTQAKLVGIDNLNGYYRVELKQYRLNRLRETSAGQRFEFVLGDIADKAVIEDVFQKYHPSVVVHLAAQAGVRYSIENPDAYVRSNLIGFYNMLEACRHNGVRHFVYASSSSVYGNSRKIPYSTADATDRPVSLYAATKKADEVMAYAYSKLYGIPMTGARFFTVYGPAGRPDMAYFSFTEKLVSGERIKLYNNGLNKRDFTYVGDVVKIVEKMIARPPAPDGDGVRYKLYNIGNNHPVDVLAFVHTLGEVLKREEILPPDLRIDEYVDLIDAQPGDVELTYADIDELQSDFAIRPTVTLEEGLEQFAKWYKAYTKR